MSPPRPILKRAPATEPIECSSSSPKSRRPLVHFPPSPKLTRTYTAHSPTTYDRSPIVVTPNACALPERGCPGKTYVLGGSPTQTKLDKSGRHLHPRAAFNGFSGSGTGLGLCFEEVTTPRSKGKPSNRDNDPERTPTSSPSTHFIPSLPYPPPPLIPDISSESEESDSFSSPLPLEASLYNNSSSSSSSSSLDIRPPVLIPNTQASYLSLDHYLNGANTSNALSFLPHPPSIPQHEEDKARRSRERSRRDRHRDRSRSRERDHERDARKKLSQLELGGIGDEEGEEQQSEWDRSKPGYRSFSNRMTNSGLLDMDEGCLAGF